MFIVNNQYTKKDIYRILDVPEGSRKGVWDTGYRRYKDEIYLFATIGGAGRTGVNHNNSWDRGDLIWFSKPKAKTSQSMIWQMLNLTYKVHIFTRSDSRESFTYNGMGRAVDHNGEQPVRIRWRFQNDSPIDAKRAWKQFSGNLKAESERKTFQGTVEQDEFIKAIHEINLRGGTVPRGSLLQNKAKETTLVWYLPMLDFDDDRTNIVVVSVSEEPLSDKLVKTFREANNDLERRFILRKLRIRLGQNKLKDNLLLVYRSRCCVTLTEVPETLHACHIIPHVDSGINHSTNGLLMRSDIHDLFDEGLLGIDPDNLVIQLNKNLVGTDYYEYNGRTLLPRSDGLRPDVEALRQRWAMYLAWPR